VVRDAFSFPSPTRASEARRVLVPGGRFAFTAWVEEGDAVAEVVDAIRDTTTAGIRRHADAEGLMLPIVARVPSAAR
jgi:hypothetical protein